MQNNAKMHIGFPDFRQEFNTHFDPLFPALQGIQQALNGVVDRGYGSVDGWQRAVLNLGRLNGVAMEELFILAANGCGHGAMKILRSILETTIEGEYLRQAPADFQRYLDWSHFERWKVYESLKVAAPAAYKSLSEVEIKGAKAAYDRVQAQFGHHKTWCGVNLREQARRSGLEDFYVLINPLASRLLHGGMFALMLHFDPGSDIHRIDVPPSLKWCQQALVGGHCCLVQTIRTLSAALGVQPEPGIDALEQQRREAWDAIAARHS